MVVTPENKLLELGIELPDVPEPLGAYVPYVRVGNFIFLSGMLPLRSGQLHHKGKVPQAVSPETAYSEAKIATINAIAVLKSAVHDLTRVTKCIKVVGYVASAHDFYGQPMVINGASDLLVDVFGDVIGRHVRVAVGASALPLDSPVEIEFIFEVSS